MPGHAAMKKCLFYLRPHAANCQNKINYCLAMLKQTWVATPGTGRRTGDAANPSSHMGLICKTGLCRDPAKPIGSSRDAQPRSTGA